MRGEKKAAFDARNERWTNWESGRGSVGVPIIHNHTTLHPECTFHACWTSLTSQAQPGSAPLRTPLALDLVHLVRSLVILIALRGRGKRLLALFCGFCLSTVASWGPDVKHEGAMIVPSWQRSIDGDGMTGSCVSVLNIFIFFCWCHVLVLEFRALPSKIIVTIVSFFSNSLGGCAGHKAIEECRSPSPRASHMMY